MKLRDTFATIDGSSTEPGSFVHASANAKALAGLARPRKRTRQAPYSVAVLAAALAAQCSSTSAGAQHARDAGDLPSIAQFMQVRAPNSPVLARDGTLFARDWDDGIQQLFRFAPGSANGVQLTSFRDGVSSYTLSPDGTKIVVAHAVGGNEQDQLSLLDAVGGPTREYVPLLANPEVVYHHNVWLADGSGFLFAANDVSPSDFYLYRYTFAPQIGGEPGIVKLLAREGSWSAQDVTRDGSRALVARYVSESDAQVYELDVASGTTTELRFVDSSGASNTAAVGYMPGEQSVLLKSDCDGGTRRLWVRDSKTGAAHRPLPELDAFELDEARMNRERDLLAVVTNEDGYGVLHAYRLPSFEPIALPSIERGVVSLSEISGSTLVWTLSNAHTPGVTFAYDTSRSAVQQARPLTRADSQGIDLSQLPTPELVHYTSFDGRSIPAFLYVPPGRAKGARIPFVVNFHGGPEGQHRPEFDRTAQALLSRGFGVMQPNPRGSTGYGRAYHQLDDYKHRLDSVKDGVEAARWLVREGYATAGRIAAYGGSYGGYMTVATVIEGQDVFGAGVDVVGIVNMQTFLEKTKGYRRKLREAEYGPLTDREFLKSISPLTRADEIHVPMLIAHGLNDPRVPVGEAMQLAVNLQRRGLDPELYFFPDEGHGFQKLANRILFTERMVRFLERTIAAAP